MAAWHSMTKPKALKVFRTPIGFHDAYVSAPTKKAALEAWGSHRNLFALGEAEQVTDPKLMRAPLATPGVVVKVSRGTIAQQLQALPPDDKVRAQKQAAPRASSQKTAAPKKVIPRPSRAKLDRAEASLAKLSAKSAAEQAAIDDEIEAIQQRRAVIVERNSHARATSQLALDQALSDYDTQLDKWRSDS